MTEPHCRGDFPYRTVDDIQYANERAGQYFFSPATMRGFGSRVLDGVYGGRYFVTSERDSGMTVDGRRYAAWDGQRRFTVREALPSGRVEDASEFGEFDTARAARRYAESIRPGFSVYLARMVAWASEYGPRDWRAAADYCGLTYGRKASRAQRERIKADRRELRRMFRLHERETVSRP